MSLNCLARLQAMLQEHDVIHELDRTHPAYALIRDVIYYISFDPDEALSHAAAFRRLRDSGELSPLSARYWRLLLRIETCVLTRSGWVEFI